LRAVLDPNVIISVALSPGGSPGRVFKAWLEGAFELVVSNKVLAELERAMNYPKLASRISQDETIELLDLLERGGKTADEPVNPPEVRSEDPDDDYLIALASSTQSVLISGDSDLLNLSGRIPVRSPAEFLAMIVGT
jgi:putative PIN family toxin of toxin-antitoxin system